MSQPTTTLPGGTIGMLGGGQLGRMFAQAAHQLGYHVIVFDPEATGPAAQVADDFVAAKYDDLAALSRFACRCDVVTLEWENIPTAAVERVALECPVHPSPLVLCVAQDRRREKATLAGYGLPVTPFMSVDTRDELTAAAEALGYPLVLKTSRSGYDGKGQLKVNAREELLAAYEALGGVSLVAEQWIHHRRELSVIVARSLTGETVVYPLFENHHANHILDTTLFPAPESEHLTASAKQIAIGAAESLDVIGLLCVELFETETGELLINEVAPRPHNSGHVTIEAAETSQFEQHLRAICGLPLGSPAVRRPAAMVNLLGELWEDHVPDFAKALDQPDAHLHLYGKRKARPGRKMGHVTVLADSAEQAAVRARAIRQLL
ncbi:5-(carboxyamino)imidazole ribonucleotide synthase [Planctomycetaceae bacterium SH139]